MNYRLLSTLTLTLTLTLTATVVMVSCVAAREWTDKSGHYHFKGELVAGNESMVILEQGNKDLVSIAVEQLSERDQQYLRDQVEKSASNPDLRTWTTHRGIKFRAALVEYVRRQLTVRRYRGKAYTNDKRFDNLPGIYRKIIPQIVGHFEGVELDEPSFSKWVKDLGGERKTYTCEGVLMELENGDHYAIPFFLLSEEDRELLKPGYEQWAQAKDDEESREHYSMSMRAQAAADRQAQAERRQVARMHLMLQGVQAGVTSIWEVTLIPPPGGIPRRVVVPGRDSRTASVAAMQQFPGYRAGPVRRVSR